MEQMKINQKISYRNGVIENAVNERDNETENQSKNQNDDRIVKLTFSSNEKILRDFGYEILGHEKENVKFDWIDSGRAPLLFNHDPDRQIGVILNAKIIDNGKAQARVKFSKNKLGDSIYQDIRDGIVSNVSVGYIYDSVDLEEEGRNNQPSTYRVKSWQPIEISIVSVPADQTVGIERNNNINDINNYINNSNLKDKIMIENEMNNKMNDKAQFNEIRSEETKRITEILSLAKQHNVEEIANEYIKAGKSIDNFRQYVLDNIKPPEELQQQHLLGMSDKEIKNFSIVRAIRASATGNWQNAGFEKEASDAVAKNLSREASSFFVPLDIMNGNNGTNGNNAKRELKKLSNVEGGYLVDTEYLSSNFIEMLRNKMVVNQMGAKIISSIRGDIAIPKQTGGAKTFWVSEGESPEHSSQKFGQVTLSPRSVAAYTDFTRKLLLQSSPDIENLVREDLATVIALEIDRAAIIGSGRGSEPLGIMNHKGIGTVTYNNSPTWGNIVDLETKLASKNADIGSMGYLCDAKMRGILKQTEKARNTGQFVWNEEKSGVGNLNGYRAISTNQMPRDKILFGNFGDLIIGSWGVMDVLVDPYSLGTSGGIRIRVMQDIDIAIRHHESFSVLNKG